jgi:outer membrane protein TolC
LTIPIYNYIVIHHRGRIPPPGGTPVHQKLMPIVLAALGVAPGLAAQAPVLTLREALGRADSAAYGNRAAEGEADAAAARADGALQGILPTLRVEGGWMRTDEPLGAFGFLLRQRGVTTDAFAPDALNHPDEISNWAGGVVAEVPLLNADAWLGRSAASSAAAAGRAQAAWARAGTRLDVIRAYYGAVLAREAVGALEAASRAAHEHARLTASLVRNGVVTKSDALLAEVRAGEVDAQLLGARSQAGLARRRLALVMGAPSDTLFALPEVLPAPDRIRTVTGAAPVAPSGERGDVAAARLGRTAAETDARRAAGRLLPRLNAFGRLDWNDPSTPFGGQESWTVGVMASWSPFSGGAELADRSGARARASAAAAMAEAAEAEAALEVAARESELEVAIERLAIAERSVSQGAEAHRIVARKYEGGLAAIVELLGAAATETSTRLGLAQAQYQAIVADAGRRQARGGDPAALAALEE